MDGDRNLAFLCVVLDKFWALKRLVRAGASRDAGVLNSVVCAMHAIPNLHKQVIFLVENIRSPDVLNHVDQQSNTPVMNAVRYNRFRLASLIMQFNPNLAVVNSQGDNLLSLLVKKNCFSLVRLCILSGGLDGVRDDTDSLLRTAIDSDAYESFAELLASRHDFFTRSRHCFMCPARSAARSATARHAAFPGYDMKRNYKSVYWVYFVQWRSALIVTLFLIKIRRRALEDVFAPNSIIMDLCAPFLGIDDKIKCIKTKLDATAHVYNYHTVYELLV
jgi:hypothetical protein